MNEQSTYIVVPLGEWWPSLRQSFINAGIAVEQKSNRDYLIVFPDLEIKGVGVRTKSVPTYVLERESRAVAGFTGTDILVEKGLRQLNDISDWQVPLKQLTPDAPSPRVYLAETPRANPSNFVTSIEMILAGKIATTYPEVLGQFILQNNLPTPKILTDEGKIEGLWRLDDCITGVLDIASTGTTLEANGLREFCAVMEAQLVLYPNWAKMTERDMERIIKLKKCLTDAAGGSYEH